MKYFYRSALILVGVAFFSFNSSASAASVVTVLAPAPASFKVALSEINPIENTDITRFTFDTFDVVNPQNIASWKISAYCKGTSFELQVNDLIENACGKTVRIEPAAARKFFVYFSKSSGVSQDFLLRFKAYDTNGRRLHVEKQAMSWK